MKLAATLLVAVMAPALVTARLPPFAVICPATLTGVPLYVVRFRAPALVSTLPPLATEKPPLPPVAPPVELTEIFKAPSLLRVPLICIKFAPGVVWVVLTTTVPWE